MDKTVPPGAALLLDFIGDIEAPKGYDTIYGNNQKKLKKPVTQMTIGEIIDAQGGWSKAYGSSATGRYQFMKATLVGLLDELSLSRSQVFDGNLQDRLGYHLLKRRGYEKFMTGQIGHTDFGKRLAQEWASLPVLAATQGSERRVVRGQSYYAGDGLNKSLVSPERVERALEAARIAKPAPVAHNSLSAPAPAPEPAPTRHDGAHQAPASEGFWHAVFAALAALFKGKQNA
jgi:muramidase (phage lysozyme)